MVKARDNIVKAGVYKLSPNEIARLLEEEKKKRRVQRIKEVREQSKLAAARIRQAVKRKEREFMEKLVEEIQDEYEIEQQEKLAELEQLYEDSVRAIGQAHGQAEDVLKENASWKRQREAEERDKQAESRHQTALRREALDKKLRLMEQTQHIRAREAALEEERKRSAQIAALPPPITDDLEMEAQPRRKPVTFFDASTFSSTHFHMIEKDYGVEKADPDQQGDAKKSAAEQSDHLRALDENMTRRHHGRQEAAQLRGKHALYMERLKHDYDLVLDDLGARQRSDVTRRQQTLSSIPKQIFQPPSRRAEDRIERQRDLENAFQNVFMAEQGEDISLTLDSHEPTRSDDVTQSRDLPANLDTLVDEALANESAARLGTPANRQAVLKDLTNEQESTKKGLRSLMNKIRSQREAWISQTQQVIPEREDHAPSPGLEPDATPPPVIAAPSRSPQRHISPGRGVTPPERHLAPDEGPPPGDRRESPTSRQMAYSPPILRKSLEKPAVERHETSDRLPSSSRDQPPSLSREQPPSLSRDQLRSLPRDQVPSLSRDQPPSLPRDQPPTLSLDQPPSLSRDQPPTLSRDQLRSLPRDQPSSLSRDQPPSLSRDQPPTLSRDQPPSLSRDQPPSLSRDRQQRQTLQDHAQDLQKKIAELEAKRQEILAREALIQARDATLRSGRPLTSATGVTLTSDLGKPEAKSSLHPEHIKRIKAYQHEIMSRSVSDVDKPNQPRPQASFQPRPYVPSPSSAPSYHRLSGRDLSASQGFDQSARSVDLSQPGSQDSSYQPRALSQSMDTSLRSTVKPGQRSFMVEPRLAQYKSQDSYRNSMYLTKDNSHLASSVGPYSTVSDTRSVSASPVGSTGSPVQALELQPRRQSSSPSSAASYDLHDTRTTAVPMSSEDTAPQSDHSLPLDLTTRTRPSILTQPAPELSRAQTLQSGISSLLQRANQQQESIKKLREEMVSPQKSETEDWQKKLLEWMKPLSTSPDDYGTPGHSSKSSEDMELDERRLAELDSMVLDESSHDEDSESKKRPPITKKVIFQDDVTPHELSTIPEQDTPASDQSTLVPSVVSTPSSSPRKTIIIDDSFRSERISAPSRPETEGGDAFSPRPDGIVVIGGARSDDSFNTLRASEATKSESDKTALRVGVDSTLSAPSSAEKSSPGARSMPSPIMKRNGAVMIETLPHQQAEFRPKSSSSDHYSPLSQHSFSTDTDRASLPQISPDQRPLVAKSDVYSQLIKELANRTLGPDAQRPSSGSFHELVSTSSTDPSRLSNEAKIASDTKTSVHRPVESGVDKDLSQYSMTSDQESMLKAKTWREKLQPYRRPSPELGSSYLDQSSWKADSRKAPPISVEATPRESPEISQHPLDSDSPSTVQGSRMDAEGVVTSPDEDRSAGPPDELTQYASASRSDSLKSQSPIELTQYKMSTSPEKSPVSRDSKESMNSGKVLQTPDLTQIPYTSDSSAERNLTDSEKIARDDVTRSDIDSPDITQHPMSSSVISSVVDKRRQSPLPPPIVELTQYPVVTSSSTAKSSSDEQELTNPEPEPELTQLPISDSPKFEQESGSDQEKTEETWESKFAELTQIPASDGTEMRSLSQLPLSDSQMRSLTQVALTESNQEVTLAQDSAKEDSVEEKDLTQIPMSDSGLDSTKAQETLDLSHKTNVQLTQIPVESDSSSSGDEQIKITERVESDLTQFPIVETTKDSNEDTVGRVTGEFRTLTPVNRTTPVSDTETREVETPVEVLSAPEDSLTQHQFTDTVDSQHLISQRLDSDSENNTNNNNNNSNNSETNTNNNNSGGGETSVWYSATDDVINPLTTSRMTVDVGGSTVYPVTSSSETTAVTSAGSEVERRAMTLVEESRSLREGHQRSSLMFMSLMEDEELGITDEPDLTFSSLVSDSADPSPRGSIDLSHHQSQAAIPVSQSEPAALTQYWDDDQSESMLSFAAHEDSVMTTPGGRLSLLQSEGRPSGPLAEAFYRRKADFVRRSQQRVHDVRSKPRQTVTSSPPPSVSDDVTAGAEAPSAATSRDTAVSTVSLQFTDPKMLEQEKFSRTERLYGRLEEVQQRRLVEERKRTYAANREKAKEYQKKLHEKVMKKAEKRK